ncbi:MAG: hypothetical protein HZA50_01025, partial [Planctomycetes bacterium]|nr:hypothetical protein [Planctomycetota bacterium]
MLSLLLLACICQAGLILLLCRRRWRDLFLENLALRHQLGVLKRSVKRPKVKTSDRLFWMLLSRLWKNWRNALAIFQPSTIARWHRLGFRIFWRWKSRKKTGRPIADLELRQLIRQISRENPLKKAGQIRDIIKSLGYEPPDLKTIRKYMVKPFDPNRRSSTWQSFLKNHIDCSWAVDFFTVPTLTFKILYVFVVFDHG